MVNDYRSSSCHQCMKLLRILTLDNIRSNRRVYVEYVKSSKNELADALSRMNLRRFWDKAPENMKKLPEEIPKQLWPINKIWDNL